jgi:hypothetical protein
VTDVDGKVKVVATKQDVKIHLHGGSLRKSKQDESSDAIVRQGEEKTRDEHCGGYVNHAKTAGTNGIIDDPRFIGAAAGAAGLIACLGLCHDDDPISPSAP